MEVEPSGTQTKIDGPDNGVPTKSRSTHNRGKIQYGIEDCPPWYITILLGLQHYLLLFGGSVTIPLLITPAMCIGDDDVGKSEVISTVFFVDGIATLLQTTFGTRLPIMQGGAVSFITPILAVLALPKWECPQNPPANRAALVESRLMLAYSEVPFVFALDFANLTSTLNETMLAWRREVWTSRMREIQGSMALASILQILVASTGILSFVLRFIGPLCIAPTVTVIGLSLTTKAANYCSQHWGIAALTIGLITLFSQYLRDVEVPLPIYNRRHGCHIVRYPIFKLLSVFLAIVITWGFCAILTVADVFPSDPSVLGYGARTDIKLKVLEDAKWFRFPYPGQWGMPTASAAAVVGMMAGIIVGIIKAISDYQTCAHLSEVPSPPTHAINRGIFLEGIAITFAAIWGSTSGVTTYSQNVAAIGFTKVASRRVVQVGALIAIILAMLGKFGALFVTIPDPIFGGMFVVVFGLMTAVGVSSLQHVDLNSSRNLFVFGVAVFLGLSLPSWIGNHSDVIKTGNDSVDQVLFVLLNTPMLIAGLAGFLLDNTIPGTAKERGLVGWRGKHGKEEDVDQDCQSPYNLPFGMSCIRRVKWLRFLPICPTYKPTCECCTDCLPTRRQDPQNDHKSPSVSSTRETHEL